MVYLCDEDEYLGQRFFGEDRYIYTIGLWSVVYLCDEDEYLSQRFFGEDRVQRGGVEEGDDDSRGGLS